ncbi:MAG: rod shape-determining protein MreD [Pseudomonadota bacterium]
MTDASPARLWAMRSAFALLVLVILFFHLLPQQMLPRSWAGPEWVTLFAFAWAVRRPDLVPTPLLGAVLLLADFLLARPPGLWAVLALIGAERLKGRTRTLRDSTLINEIAEIAVTLIVISAAYHLILTLLLVDNTSLRLTAIQAAASILAYPAVVFVTHTLMRVRKAAPGDLEPGGSRP